MFTLFSQAGIGNAEHSYYTPCIASTVNGYHAPTKILIYVDGSTHYAVDGTLCLAYQLLDSIAQKHGYNVMRIKLPKMEVAKRKVEDVIQLSHPDI